MSEHDKAKRLYTQGYAYEKEREAEITRLRASHEAACKLVLDASLSTGHADTSEELMREVLDQVEGLRAEVKRRGEILKRCWPLAEARVLMLDKFPRNPENIEAGEGARELVAEIESLED